MKDPNSRRRTRRSRQEPIGRSVGQPVSRGRVRVLGITAVVTAASLIAAACSSSGSSTAAGSSPAASNPAVSASSSAPANASSSDAASIAAGQSVYLAYASGNRDTDVFDQPFRFDVGREPNSHLGFGAGVHFCLGAALARMEMASFFAELLPRLRSIELAGEPKLIATTLVGGLKRLPIRYEIS